MTESGGVSLRVKQPLTENFNHQVKGLKLSKAFLCHKSRNILSIQERKITIIIIMANNNQGANSNNLIPLLTVLSPMFSELYTYKRA